MRYPSERNGLVLVTDDAGEFVAYQCPQCGHRTDAKFSAQFWGAHDCINSHDVDYTRPVPPPVYAVGERVPY